MDSRVEETLDNLIDLVQKACARGFPEVLPAHPKLGVRLSDVIPQMPELAWADLLLAVQAGVTAGSLSSRRVDGIVRDEQGYFMPRGDYVSVLPQAEFAAHWDEAERLDPPATRRGFRQLPSGALRYDTGAGARAPPPQQQQQQQHLLAPVPATRALQARATASAEGVSLGDGAIDGDAVDDADAAGDESAQILVPPPSRKRRRTLHQVAISAQASK
eukprot:TRINITY_DN4768_c2_g2_i2.p1 TRINITY_DN4768_c2_g2~~TRINITY_DN4768_c2_g2_i2.p1  ORF type:complete len:217 (-),score=43.69 TRINITY_DN4768_c2_g2_i2:60-710(-)